MDYKAEINELILTLVKEKASDLHIVVGSCPIIRINNELLPLSNKSTYSSEDSALLLKEIISEKAFNKFIVNQELDFSFEHLKEYRLRGNAYFEKGFICFTLRLLSKAKSFEDLGLPSILAEISHQKQGLFLVVGPVRQGKSATLAAIIEEINSKERRHIITIEDPIETIFENNKSIIDQREIGLDTKSFDIALRQALRQDVDVLMIGEMRDKETIASAVTIAETGHLVISTLHTNSASQTINRILDSFSPEEQSQIRSQLSTSLLGIFSQRLILSTKGELIPTYELLINNSAISNLIRENRIHEIDVIIETSKDSGMIDFNRHLAELVRSGKVAIDVAMNYSKNPKILEKLI